MRRRVLETILSLVDHAPRGWRVKVTLSLDRSGSGIVDFCDVEDMHEGQRKEVQLFALIYCNKFYVNPFCPNKLHRLTD